MPNICTRVVFRCFKKLERWGDKVTGAAGPFFVGLAVILIVAGTVSFLNIVLPSLPWPLLTAPPCLIIILNMFGHYYYVCTVPPGYVDDPPQTHVDNSLLWARRSIGTPVRPQNGVRWSSEVNITKASTTRCTKCNQIKPERTHHCRICNRCVLKYDHHCPVRVNQCVGLYNERHFVLFMVYLVIGAFWYTLLGWDFILMAFGMHWNAKWPFLVPSVVFIMSYILAAVMCLAVGIMAAWHLWSVAIGETSCEGHDFEIYRKLAKSRGETFVNSYDLGKRKNLELFFNLGRDGYPIYTLFFPFRIEPYTDGRSWARRPGLERHRGVREGEDLTDEEEEEEI
ncbi:zf-DHHC-domain-containing protein [Stereum hirsutum FP-91666 SS1]|uniref:zf-DHHC-domain-containing protein n=1 Tax=Stereum hirsutum (strain FP-91666) TaxID=721885 RepID=UPI0004449584|nr:zf-DHHC-domain-containing protein [Stereum hirsutum FP-91666 SS1]EIM86060.1 zf-DHHC-domain-containing protein [Stereum hirsutum FP-91666 SS1]